MPPLTDRVALVAGATRGAGRGIACMLGEAGALVYCTGRSVAGHPPPSGHYAGRPETIEQTAAQVAERGGRAVACRVDHGNEADVQTLADRLLTEQGRLDLLVLDFWGDEEPVPFGAPFWEIPLDAGRATIAKTLWPHVITLQRLVPLMLRAAENRGWSPLVIEVTDGPTLTYRTSLFFDLASTLRARLSYAIAEELAPHGITALAVTPGYLRSELTLDRFGVSEANWRDAVTRDRHFAASESPCLLGRGVAALAADPHASRFAGGILGSWELAAEYGLRDVDGTRPDFGRHLATSGTFTPTRHTGAHWHVTREASTKYQSMQGAQS
jgi:NAD(P)-dependent dehydrogenase (short-subunit alcohol dehydrogenase family)